MNFHDFFTSAVMGGRKSCSEYLFLNFFLKDRMTLILLNLE